MTSRILSTFILLMFSAAALSSGIWAQPSDHYVFLALGILLAALAILNWFVWGELREGSNYGRSSGRDGAKLPALAWSGPIFINGIFNMWRQDDQHEPSSDAKHGADDDT
jgi:hypothetical protein